MKLSKCCTTVFFGIVLFVLYMQPRLCSAQYADSLNMEQNITIDSVDIKPHSPHKATLYSMMLPGLGQAYNKKYWKIPLIYAGFGTFGYFIVTNNREYQKYRDAYLHVVNGEEGDPPNEFVEKYTEDQLRAQKNYYQRNLEFTYILTAVWYILNVVDAAVDAHLYDFNVDDNLSLGVLPPNVSLSNPSFPGKQTHSYGGITLKIKL